AAHEVVRPDLVGSTGLEVPDRVHRQPLRLLPARLRTPRWNSMSLQAPQPLHPLPVHLPALSFEQRRDHPVAPARVLDRQLVHPLDQPQLEVGRHRLIPLRRPVLLQQSASPTLRHAVTAAEIGDGLSAARRAQSLPRVTSLSIEMSSACSATIRLRREFSCSSTLSRWASSSFKAPYFRRQR